MKFLPYVAGDQEIQILLNIKEYFDKKINKYNSAFININCEHIKPSIQFTFYEITVIGKVLKKIILVITGFFHNFMGKLMKN